jgi:hypothetical protein
MEFMTKSLTNQILKISKRHLYMLTPDHSRETYAQKVEELLRSRGYEFESPDEKQISGLKYIAFNYWISNKHPDLAELSWLHAYCYFLNIDLDLTF